MSLLSRVGNVLRQRTRGHANSQVSISVPSAYQVIRYMSSSKVFVGGISYATDDQSLKEAFAKYGQVVEARVIVDRETERSRGFGFVTYTSSEEASCAIQALDEQDLHGRKIRVNYATDKARGFGRSGGFGGGYGAPGIGGGFAGNSYGHNPSYGSRNQSFGNSDTDGYGRGNFGVDNTYHGNDNASFGSSDGFDSSDRFSGEFHCSTELGEEGRLGDVGKEGIEGPGGFAQDTNGERSIDDNFNRVSKTA